MTAQNKLIAWVKTHKKELIFAGISIGALIGIILGIKNRKEIMRLWRMLQEAVTKSKTPVTPVVKPTVAKQVVEKAPVDVLKVCVDSAPEALEQCTEQGVCRAPYTVPMNIRNLHPGWQASAKKLAEAEALGIALQPGQTLVDEYTTGGIAA